MALQKRRDDIIQPLTKAMSGCMKIEYETHIGRGIQLTDVDLIINVVTGKGNIEKHNPIQATDIACRWFESSSAND